MHNISWFPFNLLDTFVEELFEVRYNIKFISYVSAQIEDWVWWSVAASYERCAILQQGALCPDIFCKGPTHGNLCAHMHHISLCWPQPETNCKNQHVMPYTQCICKWSVRRLHQDIISFSGISVNDRLTKIWLGKADGRSTFTVR